jgi:hypothetical protein
VTTNFIMDREVLETSEEHVEDGQTAFVGILTKYPELLCKSQVPGKLQAKKKAAAAMVKDLEMTLGQRTDEAKLTKKINNMKAAVKKKTDLNATGNKKIILAAWETAFLQLIQSETNPVFSKVPGIRYRYKHSFMINN